MPSLCPNDTKCSLKAAKCSLDVKVPLSERLAWQASTSSLCASDVLELLVQEDLQDGLQQSMDISEEDLTMIMDRDDLLGKKAAYPAVGPGWEVVTEATGSALLGGVA
jgi:hypothetical protein